LIRPDASPASRSATPASAEIETGYGGGLERKEQLLRLEGARLF
jgi:hypothetical protein